MCGNLFWKIPPLISYQIISTLIRQCFVLFGVVIPDCHDVTGGHTIDFLSSLVGQKVIFRSNVFSLKTQACMVRPQSGIYMGTCECVY